MRPTPNDLAAAETSSAAEFARAKVNLALHITGRRADGYHLLDSLVVFPQIGDQLSATPAKSFSLVVEGPFAEGLQGETSDNLVLKAAKALTERSQMPNRALALKLEKNLPVASGIGGGSADAAAALRLAARLFGISLEPDDLRTLALTLGADVPVCLDQETTRMSGIGDILAPVPRMPEADIVLVNPGVAVSTPAIFSGLESRENTPMPDMPGCFQDLSALLSYLEATRNDMQSTAERLCPDVGNVLQELAHVTSVRLARMSGSGATCFALCPKGFGNAVADRIRKSHPDWWVASSRI